MLVKRQHSCCIRKFSSDPFAGQLEHCIDLRAGPPHLQDHALSEDAGACLSTVFRPSLCGILSTARAAGMLPMKSSTQLGSWIYSPGNEGNNGKRKTSRRLTVTSTAAQTGMACARP